MATIVDAFAAVEMVLVVLIVTTEPDSDMFCEPTVMWRVPSAEASAVMLVVEPSTRLKPLNTAFLTIVVI